MELQPGDVVCVWDRYTTPEKPKWHICLCPDTRVFLRINSRAYWPPYHVMYADHCDFLEHDSYVELQQFWQHARSDLKTAEVIGSLSHEEAARLCTSINAAVTLSPEQKAFARQRLLGEDI